MSDQIMISPFKYPSLAMTSLAMTCIALPCHTVNTLEILEIGFDWILLGWIIVSQCSRGTLHVNFICSCSFHFILFDVLHAPLHGAHQQRI
jgi:hypothetical protein